MKTAGRLTALLLSLLALYLLGYWFLIKNHWADKLLFNPSDPFSTTQAYNAVQYAYRPLGELDYYLNVVVPIRKHLTGYWHTNINGNFVIFGPRDECRFQLGHFALNGTAQFDRSIPGFTMDFLHKNKAYQFELSLDFAPSHSAATEQASAVIRSKSRDPFSDPIDYRTTLSKHPPSAPAP